MFGTLLKAFRIVLGTALGLIALLAAVLFLKRFLDGLLTAFKRGKPDSKQSGLVQK